MGVSNVSLEVMVVDREPQKSNLKLAKDDEDIEK